MNNTITVARALGYVLLKDILNIVTIVGALIIGSLLALSIWLTNSVSGWWGLLVFVIVTIGIIAAGIRLLLGWLIKRLYPQPLSSQQKKKTREFIQKMQGIADVRAMGWPLFVLITIKDVIRHRDVTTIKKVVSDSSTLRGDLRELERVYDRKQLS